MTRYEDSEGASDVGSEEEEDDEEAGEPEEEGVEDDAAAGKFRLNTSPLYAVANEFVEPKAKKRKTQAPEEVEDEDGVEEVDDEEVDGKDLEDDEEEEGGDEDEDAEDTAKKSGPTASAKSRKGKQVPKEDDLEEVEAAE